MESGISIAKDIANILFFVIAGIVTILTYRHAKKTLFAPLRTEAFKLQLEAISNVLECFQGKGEHQFMEEFDIHNAFMLNFGTLMDDYVTTKFKDKVRINKERLRERELAIAGSFFSQDYAMKYLEVIDNPKPKSESASEPSTSWDEYVYGCIHITKIASDRFQALQSLASSPLLPLDLRKRINAFEECGHRNFMMIGTVLTDIAKHLESNFSSPEELMRVDASWAWNQYNSQRSSFEAYSKPILDHINKYLSIESILKT